MNDYTQQEQDKLDELNKHIKHHGVKDHRITYKGYSVFISHRSGKVRVGGVNEKIEHLLNTIDNLLLINGKTY